MLRSCVMLDDTSGGEDREAHDEPTKARQDRPLRTVSRPYEPGDEVHINGLYKLITGRDRGAAEFAWEWLDTWDGQGSMHLLFDLDREEGDQLIAQYSLLPIPLSVWGRPTVAGKTENCMSHFEYRGSGAYFAHERQCFEEEKKRFSFFFTTTGEIVGGAPGKVRMKLGYTAFDDWAVYALWLRTGALREELRAMMAAKGKAGKALAPVLSGLLAPLVQAYSHVRRRHMCRYRVAVHREADAPLDEIAGLWERNREHYGISVDRSAKYLQWRVNDNPHLEHEFVTMYGDGRLLGYVIYYVQGDKMYVADILAEGARTDLFRHLLAALAKRGRELAVGRVTCVTLRRSRLLPQRVRSAGFLAPPVVRPPNFIRAYRPRQFFLYIPEELRGDPKVSSHDSWYVTEFFLEGRRRGQSAA